MFVSHLAQEGLSHTTIKVYLSAVRYQHITAGFYNEFASHLTPKLEMVLKGIKKDMASRQNTPPRRVKVEQAFVSAGSSNGKEVIQVME